MTAAGSVVPQRNEALLFLGGLITMVILLVSLGSITAMYVLRGYEVERLETELEAARANARTAWGKVYDMQETHDEALAEAQSQAQLRVWELEQQLATCPRPPSTNGAKP